MESDPTRINELLVGLGADVEVVSVGDEPGRPLRVLVRLRSPRPVCGSCGGQVWSNGARSVGLADLGAFGRPVRLVLAKRRWRCPNGDCAVGTFTEQAAETAPARARLTSRAARWATRQVGRGRTVAEIAAELGWVWHTVMGEVRRWGTALLAADRGRIDGVTALGLDEILMWRHRKYRRKQWGTTITDARRGILLDIVAGRTANPAIKWLGARSPQWRRAVRWAVMDLSGPYRKAFDTALRHARQVADPFGVVRLANQMGRRGAPPRPQRHARRSGHQQRPAVPGPQAAHHGPRTPQHPQRREAARPARSRRSPRRGARRLARQTNPPPDLPDPQPPPRTASHRRPRPRSARPRLVPGDEQTRPHPGTIAGGPRSRTGTARASPTDPPRQRTISPSSSNAQRSGSPTSSTTESEHSSTPANPTRHSSTPSLHPKTRRATFELAAGPR